MQRFIEEAGFSIVSAEFVIVPPAQTELSVHWGNLPEALRKSLGQNRFGNVFQVVMKVAASATNRPGIRLEEIPVPHK